MNNALSFIQNHWSDVAKAIAALWTFLSVINGMLKDSKVKTYLGELLNVLSFLTRSDASGTFKVPMSADKKPNLTLMSMILIAFIPGCGYCKSPAYQNTVGCKIERVVTKCGAKVVFDVAMSVLPAVVADLVSSDYSNLLTILESDLKANGVSDAKSAIECAVQVAGRGSSPAPNGSVPGASLIHERSMVFLADR